MLMNVEGKKLRWSVSKSQNNGKLPFHSGIEIKKKCSENQSLSKAWMLNAKNRSLEQTRSQKHALF